MKKKQMTYSELVNHVEGCNYLRTKWDVVCFLIGYQKVITEADLEHIMRLRDDHYIDD